MLMEKTAIYATLGWPSKRNTANVLNVHRGVRIGNELLHRWKASLLNVFMFKYSFRLFCDIFFPSMIISFLVSSENFLGTSLSFVISLNCICIVRLIIRIYYLLLFVNHYFINFHIFFTRFSLWISVGRCRILSAVNHVPYLVINRYDPPYSLVYISKYRNSDTVFRPDNGRLM